MNALLSRRTFAALAAGAPAVLRGAAMSSPERVNRALAGKSIDRPPFCLWHHFGLEKQGPAAHAKRTLQFHRDYKTDFLKVMSDFPYPKNEKGVIDSPFPQQLEALRIIAAERPSGYHFVETLFNPWTVAEKLTSAAEVKRMMKEEPQRLLDWLGVIARSEANHARKAIALGASGIFLAIANAREGMLTRAEYAKFSEPFDRIVLAAANSAAMNILHIHGEKTHTDLFLAKWNAVVHYSVPETGTSFASARKSYRGVLMGGVDHRNYRSASVDDLKAQIARATSEAGSRLLLAPSCSVPDDSKPEELARLAAAAGA